MWKCFSAAYSIQMKRLGQKFFSHPPQYEKASTVNLVKEKNLGLQKCFQLGANMHVLELFSSKNCMY